MRFKKVNIEYWTYTDGSDFNNVDKFLDEIDHKYFLTVNKKRSDAAGGGIYDLIIEITEDISLLELANSYVEDGIKVVIGIFLKSLFDPIRELFKTNKEKYPEIDKIILDFKDCKVTLYEIYPNGIEENFEKIMKKLFELRLSKKNFKKYKSIYIPILNHIDSYKLCQYRVKLSVDEPKIDFRPEDYFECWGIKRKKKKQIYFTDDGKIITEKFYTQSEYDQLLNKAFDNGEIN